MDADGLPIVGAGINYSKVDPFHQKRTLTFLNHFLIRTTSFLNHFATVCDEKLENLLLRIQRLEASMSILEAKLSSIPGLDDVSISNQNYLSNDVEPSVVAPNHEDAESKVYIQSSKSLPTKAETEVEKPSKTVSQDPRFAKYFKMVNMGVPVAAVKLKMNCEGVTPDLLDNPDAPAPPGNSVFSSRDRGSSGSDSNSDSSSD